MDTKVLVYDSQKGYFELLKRIIKGFSFYRYNGENTGQEYSIIAFFMHEKMEVLDFLKIYREDTPVVFAAPGMNGQCSGNIRCLDLRLNKDRIAQSLKEIFSSVAVK